MKHGLRSLAALAACLVALHADAAQSPRDALVRPVSWLAGHLNDPNLVLLHVGDRGEYDAAHLPGARHISMDDLSVSDHSGVGLHLEMLAPDVLRQHLQSFGISNASQIVVYYGKDWISPATRVIFTLDYAGLGDHTALLDGGQEAWVRDGHPADGRCAAGAAGHVVAAHDQANRRGCRLRAGASRCGEGHSGRWPQPFVLRRRRDRRLDGPEASHRPHRRREEHSIHRADRRST